MTVNIDIDLNARSAFVKLNGLKGMIEALDDELDLDLDLDGDLGDTLDNLSDTMEDISESFNADLNESIDRLEDIEFDFGNAPVRGGGDSGGGTGSDSGDKSALQWAQQYANGYGGDETDARSFDTIGKSFRKREKRLAEQLKGKLPVEFGFFKEEGSILDRGQAKTLDEDGAAALQRKIDSLFTSDDFDFNINLDATNREGKLMGDSNLGLSSFGRYREMASIEGDLSPGGGGLPSILSGNKKRSKLNLLASGAEGFSEGLDSIGGSLRRLVPRMSTWFNLLAVSIPALAAVAVQALGVASAFGAIAIAGASMVGLGLLGGGETMEESFRNAGEELDSLKQDLFDTFQPAMQLFSGVQSEFFDFMPGELDRVQQSMQGLLPLKDEFFEMFTQLTKFISQFFGAISSNEGLITSLWDSFKGILGTEIIKFFEWLMQTTEENQPMLKELGRILKVVALGFYEVFVMVSRSMMMLGPFFKLVGRTAKLLNNSLVSALLATVFVLWSVTTAVSFLWTSFLGLGTSMLTSMIPAISAMILKMSAWIGGAFAAAGANTALAASIGLVTSAVIALLSVSGIGLLLAGGGLLGGKMLKKKMGIDAATQRNATGGGSSSQNVSNYYEGDTVNVDLSNGDTADYEKFADMGSGGGDLGTINGSYTG